MKVLVTGATGFLGSHLVRALLKKGHQVIVLKRSFSETWRIADILTQMVAYDIDRCELEKPFVEQGRIDAVIHTATCYGRKDENVSEVLEANVIFPLRLLELAARFNISKFLNTDTYFAKTKKHYTFLSGYVISKKQFREWGKYIADSRGTLFINFIMEHLYGPKDADSKFVTQIIKGCLENIPEIELTLGEQKRDFIFIDDVISALLIVLVKEDFKSDFLEFNLGCGKVTPIREFVELVHGMTKSKTRLNFGAIPYRDNEIMVSRADNQALLRLGWNCRVDLQQGVEQTVSAMKVAAQ